MRRKIYSFMGSHELNREETIEFLKEVNKPIKYTYGLEYRGPTTHKVPMTAEKAIQTFKQGGAIDITEHDDYVHVNEFSGNDLW